MARSRWSRRLRLGYGLRHQNPPLSCAGKGKTIVAGYPWFTDWGRDTFISLRGLCLTTDRLDDARDILLEWAGVVSQGMLPNRFPDLGDEPEYNSVDASLWYIIAVYHQGTVWPWLIGAFVEAWLRVRAGTLDAKVRRDSAFSRP